MRPSYVVFAALLFAAHDCRSPEDDVGHSLRRMLDIRTIENNGSDVRIPGYMYALYKDPGNRQYDVIRSVSPITESFDGYTMFIYDLSVLELTERIQKAVLQLETNPNNQFGNAINISFYSFAKQTLAKTYLGSASIRRTLDLADILDLRSLIGLNQLVVEMDDPVNTSMGLVLYSSTTTNKYVKGHELATFLLETTNKRRRRSIHDNEIDAKENNFTDQPKRKKKKKKGSRINKLQAVDTGDAIVFANTDQCRMEKLVLNFADIGWEDWVIYPKEFETNYCAGGCLFPLGKDSRPTNHATVQSLARSFGRLWDLPEPSCVPDTLAPLTLLYMDRSNHVLLKSYPDMRVVTCACK